MLLSAAYLAQREAGPDDGVLCLQLANCTDCSSAISNAVGLVLASQFATCIHTVPTFGVLKPEGRLYSEKPEIFSQGGD